MLVASVREEGRGWIPAMGNSDAHRHPDPVGTPQTVVLADDLTREAIQEGLKAGRSYVAESKSVSLDLHGVRPEGEHAGIGGRLKVDRDDPVTVRLEVTGAPRCTARFVTDQGVLHTSPVLPVSGSGTVEWRTTASVRGVRTGGTAARGGGGTAAGGTGGVHEPDLLGAVVGPA